MKPGGWFFPVSGLIFNIKQSYFCPGKIEVLLKNPAFLA